MVVEDVDALGTVAEGAVEVQVKAEEEITILPTQPTTLHLKNGKHLDQEIEHLSCR
jgi:hypothetical protein